MEYLIEQYGDISVYWTLELDGGGRSFGQHFVPIVQNMIGKVHRIFDFCAGAGFIGFSLLASGLCETLCLADINPAAVDAALKTVKENGLEDKVTVYLSDCLKSIPEHERWDLVVGNPPHFRVASEAEYQEDIIRFDPGWRIHEAFYGDVSRFLQPHGSVILLENYSGSNESTFTTLIEQGGLELVKSFMYRDDSPWINAHYFVWSRKAYAGVVNRDEQPLDVKIVVSELREKPFVKNFDRFEKVRLEIVNDMDHAAKIGLQTHSSELDRVITVPQRAKVTSGIFLPPVGSLYVVHLDGGVHRLCTWC
jgi:16S rRNA G966 N2-methylase RsmD